MDSARLAVTSQSLPIADLRSWQSRGGKTAGRGQGKTQAIDRAALQDGSGVPRQTDAAADQTSYQAIIIKTAERAPFAVDRTGGGLDVLGQLLLGNHGTASVLVQAEFREGVIDLMKQTQLADGSWTPGNQFAHSESDNNNVGHARPVSKRSPRSEALHNDRESDRLSAAAPIESRQSRMARNAAAV